MNGFRARSSVFLSLSGPQAILTPPCPSASGSPTMPFASKPAASASGALCGSFTKSRIKSRALWLGAQISSRASELMFFLSMRLSSLISIPRHLRSSAGSSERSCDALMSAASLFPFPASPRLSDSCSFPSGRSAIPYLLKSFCRAALTSPSLSSLRCCGYRYIREHIRLRFAES